MYDILFIKKPLKPLKMIQHSGILTLCILMISNIHCYCPDSLETLMVVSSCPENKSEWEASASRKQCSKYNQSCTKSSNFMYHCLINAYLNETIEVCAPSVFITDYCCEFNKIGAVIQRNYNADCRTFYSNPCNEPYFSYESYKYPGCYKLVKRQQFTLVTNLTMKTYTSDSPITTPGYNSDDEPVLIITVPLSLLVIGSIAIVIVGYCRKKRRENIMQIRNRAVNFFSILKQSGINLRNVQKEEKEETELDIIVL